MGVKISLPSVAEEFLRTDGRWHRSTLTLFHGWMSSQDLMFDDLTQTHIGQFWERLRTRNLADSTLSVHRARLHKYLFWLHQKDVLSFVVEPMHHVSRSHDLPVPAQRFLEIQNRQRCKQAVRVFHDWLQRQDIDLLELTSDHLERFLRQPISTPIQKISSKQLYRHIEPYLLWLHEQDLLSFRDKRPVSKPFPLPDSARHFVDTLRPVRKPGTCFACVCNLRDFHVWLSAQGIPFQALKRTDIEPWLTSIAVRGLAPGTRYARILNVRRYLHWSFEQGIIDVHPDELIRLSDLPKLPSYLPRPFPCDADRELQRRFCESGTLYGKALFVMRRTGVRIGELVRLEPNCLVEDLHGNHLMKVPLGKLDNERLVPIDKRTQQIVSSLQRQCRNDDQYLLLPTRARQTLTTRLRAALKNFAGGLDIPGPIVSHRLRHTYATELINAGMRLFDIMKLLGHRRIGMTMRYASITQDTIIRDYHCAIAKISKEYELPQKSNIAATPDPDRMLRDVISYLRNTEDARALRLINRVHKLRYDIASL